MRFLLVALAGLLLAQDPGSPKIPELVERLGAEDAAVRSEAERQLKILGKAALVDLQKGAGSQDSERAARSKRLLRILELRETLPPAILQVFPDAPDRLAIGAGEWTKLFVQAAARM